MLCAASDEPPRYLGRALKRQLIQRLLTEALRSNQLKYFAPIADTAGLIDLVDGIISDLKRQEVRPEQFSKLIDSLEPSDKNREIAWLYGEYQRLLDRHQMHDIEGRFWAAAEFLRQTSPERWGPLANIQHLVIDGFTDFTSSQHEVLSQIVIRAAKLKELTVTLPLEEYTARGGLFDKPQRTLQQLQTRYPKINRPSSTSPNSRRMAGSDASRAKSVLQS